MIDTHKDEVVASIKVGERPWNMALSCSGDRLFIANGRSNSVSVIGTATNRVIRTIAVGNKPWGVATH